MTLRTRLSALEKSVRPEDDLSHLTNEELNEQLWQLFHVSKAHQGESVTEAEEELFRTDPKRALVESARWELDHWSDDYPDLTEEYRRLVVALESKNPFENMHIRIQEELERFKLQNGIGGDERQ